ncbi:Asp-tRNA(Asn)/Glu-tRNA(Gln) amidotransferase subunit GatB [Ferruginivarius sediminum]|uniref:Aspartyl/glutamyl-tRNA(Asn/Gln) amidotransferase subunit B n=1 Tax=Ferruginivarius sediminum TaxID=2661937 RepID=A0A369TC04_9PROT|nr:Asp-tRNA(Asn)/Glu-tRNA(Gln) amidotransferase subunit GatB [Ferruginivarius sediminum]RDD62810.1 Asp-tRNA(Asn)/Glu-tRNA(Gln) amidotransferase GatCAB subunit B [Ferruginivarius sediminum]
MASYRIAGNTGEWEVVCGLEIHAQIISKSKLFSAAATEFGGEPNSQVSPVDAGMPGMLPVINRFCVEQAIKTGLGLRAQINRHSVFERKNYFYADLPQGYQISQYLEPLVGEGTVYLDMPDGEVIPVGIERLHMEQDAGKSLHDQEPGKTYIDLNRSGVALMEIVSKPDIRSPEQAGAYIQKLRSILRYLGTCDGNMAEGSLRCDINVSVRKPGAGLGTRCEVKNVNSVRFVMHAIEAEATRQIELIEEGGEVIQETRLYDPRKGETRSMRGKEEAHDYRYFPDPDLLPLIVENDWVERIKADMPELPDEKKQRFIQDYGLGAYDAGVLVAERETADFYEDVANGRDAKTAANWVTGEFFGAMNKAGVDLDEAPVNAAMLGELLDLMADNTISGRIAKDVFEEMWETGKKAGAIVEEKGLKQITDTGELEAILDKVIAENPEQVQQVKDGNQKVMGWFVGQAMKATGGKANPKMVNELLRKKLG